MAREVGGKVAQRAFAEAQPMLQEADLLLARAGKKLSGFSLLDFLDENPGREKPREQQAEQQRKAGFYTGRRGHSPGLEEIGGLRHAQTTGTREGFIRKIRFSVEPWQTQIRDWREDPPRAR
jgi:hypothetical protein